MKIILVVTDSKRKNLVFVSDKLDILSLDEAVKLAKEGKIEGVHIVRRSSGTYLRTNKGVPKSEELDKLSISVNDLYTWTRGLKIPKEVSAFSRYLDLYSKSLSETQSYIDPVGRPRVLEHVVRDRLRSHRDLVFEAARHYKIDPYILGAILIDEIARVNPIEDISDKAKAKLGFDASGGVAQVKIETAYGLFKLGYYNPNPDDPKLSFKSLDKDSRLHFYDYLIQPRHSIFFAAARVRYLGDCRLAQNFINWQKNF